MLEETANVFQFKITLKLPDPIWRRILVPENYNFWEFSVAIQDAMGNADSRLHFFRIQNPQTLRMEVIGTPKDKKSLPFCEINGTTAFLGDYFSSDYRNAIYVYDNRKYWQYEIRCESKIPEIPGTNYPRCIGGQRAHPPRHFQNIFKFVFFLDYVEAYKHDGEKLKQRLQSFMGKDFKFEDFQLEDFDPKSVIFDDPKQRMKKHNIV